MKDSEAIRLLRHLHDRRSSPVSTASIAGTLYQRSRKPFNRAFTLLRSLEGRRFVSRSSKNKQWTWLITTAGIDHFHLLTDIGP